MEIFHNNLSTFHPFLQYSSIIGFIIFLFFIFKQKKNSILLGFFFYILFHYSISATHTIYTLIYHIKYFFADSNFFNEYMALQNPVLKNIYVPSDIYEQFQWDQLKIRNLKNNFSNYLFFFIMIISFIFFAKNIFLKKIIPQNLNFLLFFALFFLIICLNSVYQNFSNLEIVFRDLFLIGVSLFGLFYYLTYRNFEQEIIIKKNLKYFIAIILLLMFFLSLLEVNLGFTFSHTRTSNDDNIFRANNLFLNSNVLAVWLAFFYLSISFLHAKEKKINFYYILVIFLLSLNLYLTGSRSIIYLILLFEVIKFLLYPKKIYYSLPVINLVFTFTIFYLICLFLSKNLILNSYNLSILFERYIDSIVYIPIALLKILQSVLPNLISINTSGYETLPPEVQMSIKGRFAAGVQSDNGWYNLIKQNLMFSIFYIVFILYLKLKCLYIFFQRKKHDYLFIFLILNFSSLLAGIINFVSYPIWVLYILMFVYINFYIYKNEKNLI